jgi:hypothetical protein
MSLTYRLLLIQRLSVKYLSKTSTSRASIAWVATVAIARTPKTLIISYFRLILSPSHRPSGLVYYQVHCLIAIPKTNSNMKITSILLFLLPVFALASVRQVDDASEHDVRSLQSKVSTGIRTRTRMNQSYRPSNEVVKQ